MLRYVAEIKAVNSLFQIRFVTSDEDHRIKIKVVEVQELDFREIKRHLRIGEPVVIKPQPGKNLKPVCLQEKMQLDHGILSMSESGSREKFEVSRNDLVNSDF